jgi:hypothetical protein
MDNLKNNQWKIKYDELSDTLTVIFQPVTEVMSLELTDHILLGIQPQTHIPVKLSLFDYSILAQPTLTELQSFPMTGFTKLPHSFQLTVIQHLQQAPLCHFLHLSSYPAEPLPIISLEPILIPPFNCTIPA